MTPYDRGDVVLLSYPASDSLDMHLRPALVIHSVHESDTGVAVTPIGVEPSKTFRSLSVPLGSYEAARMGLLSSGYLIACPEITVDKQFVTKRIGRCPWQLLNQFIDMLRQPLIQCTVAEKPRTEHGSERLVREAAG